MPEDVIPTLDTTPAEPAPDESIEPTTEGSDPEGSEADPSGEPEGQEQHPPAEGNDGSPILDGKRLSEAAKATLAEIKAKDPKLAAQLKSALFTADALRRAVPGGLKEVAELRQQIENLGGADGIQAMRAEQQQWKALDEQFVSGDPKFIESIAEASPEAFAKIAPAAFAKFQELHPEGYSAYVSQVFVADMLQEGIPLALERLQDFIADNPKALQVWQKLAGYVNRVNGFAQKPVNAPAMQQRPQAGDDRERMLTEREQNLTRTEWRGAADSERMNVFNAEYARLTAGRKIGDSQAAAIKELYVSRLSAALRKAPHFNANIDKYFANKDRSGYLRYIGSLYKQEIPKALRSAVDSVLPAKPGPAAKPAATAKPATNAAPAAPANGYAWLATVPAKDKIDFRQTTPNMIREGKAVLVDGKKVQWKK